LSVFSFPILPHCLLTPWPHHLLPSAALQSPRTFAGFPAPTTPRRIPRTTATSPDSYLRHARSAPASPPVTRGGTRCPYAEIVACGMLIASLPLGMEFPRWNLLRPR
jgi:hypothetical protein